MVSLALGLQAMTSWIRRRSSWQRLQRFLSSSSGPRGLGLKPGIVGSLQPGRCFQILSSRPEIANCRFASARPSFQVLSGRPEIAKCCFASARREFSGSVRSPELKPETENPRFAEARQHFSGFPPLGAYNISKAREKLESRLEAPWWAMGHTETNTPCCSCTTLYWGPAA